MDIVDDQYHVQVTFTDLVSAVARLPTKDRDSGARGSIVGAVDRTKNALLNVLFLGFTDHVLNRTT